jgi:DNA-binding PadR family transcriptional regulator
MAVDHYKSKQIAHERMGWRSKKYLGTKSYELQRRADDFAAKGWLEMQCFGNERKIPYYRLTSKGREAFMAKGSRLKWVPGWFESEHQHTLDRTRLNLNNDGWYSSKDVSVDERLIRDGYVEVRMMKRGLRGLRYFRITTKGRLFLRKAIPLAFLKRYQAGIKELAKTYRQDVASARSSMKSGTKDALSALDVNDFWRYGISGTIRKFSIGV